MIDKVFILTCNRVNTQITYGSLSPKWKAKTVMVVQAHERDQYNYPCEYLVLPDDIHFSDTKAIGKTRQFVYNYAKDMRYAILDDDLKFKRRNSKYWTGESNMETSARDCTDADINEMFDKFDSWLDGDIAFCGNSQTNNHPADCEYRDNASLPACCWIDGPKIKDIIETMDFTKVSVSEDVYFFLTLLTNGRQNRVSTEFALDNRSYNTKSLKSDLWEAIDRETITKDHLVLAKTFPEIYTILYNPSSEDRSGGYRDFGKTRIKWSKAYKLYEQNKNRNTLDGFFS